MSIFAVRLALAVLLFSIAGAASGQDGSPAEAVQLIKRAAELQRAGRTLEAVPLAERALTLLEQTPGTQAADLASAHGELGALYREAGAYAKAESQLERALAITEKLVGPDHPRTARLLNEFGSLYVQTGAFTKAQATVQRALAINERELSPEHSQIAVSLNQLAVAYAGTGDYAKAEALYLRSLAIMEKVHGPEHRNTATSLANLATLYQLSGAYAKAEPLLQRSLAIREQAFGPDHLSTALSLTGLGTVYSAMGAYAKAEPLQTRALAIMEKALGPEHPSTAMVLNNLGEVCYWTGAYAKAEALFQRSLAIREKVLGANHPDTLISVSNLAEALSANGSTAQAESLHQRAASSNEKVLGPEHPSTAAALNNLGVAYLSRAQYTKAVAVFERALAIREKALGPASAQTAATLANLASVYAVTHQYAKAVPLMQRALANHEAALGPAHPKTAAILDNLADVYRMSGQRARAAPLDERVQKIHEDNTVRFLLSGSELRQLQYVRQAAMQVSRVVGRSLERRSPGSNVLGLTTVLRYKGRVLDVMSDGVARLRRNATVEDRKLFDQLSGVAQEFSSLIYRGPEGLSSDAYRGRLNVLTARQEQLQAQLSARSAVFRETVAPATLEAVRAALPEDAVLVEWVRYGTFGMQPTGAFEGEAPRYMAYVLKRTGNPIAVDAGAAAPLEALMVEFRAALLDPSAEGRGASRTGALRADLGQLTALLSAKLIKPLAAHLPKGGRLLVSADGALNLIPFATLVDERGEYLARRYEISYLTSGRDLLRLRTDVPARNAAVVLAAPAYGDASKLQQIGMPSVRAAEFDRSGLVFNALPGTASEAEALQSLLGLDAQQVLTGAQATEAQLRTLQGPRILHLATHGFFLQDAELTAITASVVPQGSVPSTMLSENPLLRSGLALAGANERNSGGGDDGILTAAEVAQLDLLGTQLVVLSACETALGRVDAGEGVHGLRRALVLAGAQSQLVSLWKVDDAGTQQLMREYYRRLLAGEGRSAALRAVQLDMLADPQRRHPYHWGAFIPIGNWTPLTK